MLSIIQLQALLLLTLVSYALAVPTKISPIQKRSFKVERVPNPAFTRTPGAGTRALIKAHRKYGVALPDGLVAAMNEAKGGNVADGLTNVASVQVGQESNKAESAPSVSTGGVSSAAANGSAKSGTGLVTATPEDGDVEYLCPVNIGGQTVNLDLDSGSADLWVFSTELNANSQTGHKVFDATKSTTFKKLDGASWNISYGDGSGASGIVGKETVTIGGMAVPNQAVELANKVSQSFVKDVGSNGLLGLSFSKLNTVTPEKQKTFFDNALPNLAQPVFTADLRSQAVGSYEFGNIDSTKFNGTLQWAPINSTSGFWQFSSNTFQVGNGAPMNVPNGQAIADTGTTLMLANPAVVNAYYSQVKGAANNAEVGGVVFDCKTKLPDLQFDVGGKFMATVRGTDINFAQVDQTGTTCFGGLQAIGGNLQIYGDIMFKSQFVVFNGGNSSIGMAPHL